MLECKTALQSYEGAKVTCWGLLYGQNARKLFGFSRHGCGHSSAALKWGGRLVQAQPQHDPGLLWVLCSLAYHCHGASISMLCILSEITGILMLHKSAAVGVESEEQHLTL